MANTLINNVILGQTIAAKLPGKLKFSAVAVMDTQLVGQAGDSIKVDKYAYIGEATDVAEGTQIPVADLTQTSVTKVIKKAGKGVKLTDEEVKRKGNAVVTEVENQLLMSVADKVDSDTLAEVVKAPLKHTCTGKLSLAEIVKAKTLFADENDDFLYGLYINPAQEADILLAQGFIPASQLGDKLMLEGSIGRLGGCDIIKSRKVKKTTNAYKNPIIRAGAIEIKLGKAAFIEEDRQAGLQITTYYGSEMYVPSIKDDTGVVVMTTNETV